jgi:hypothetical protein
LKDKRRIIHSGVWDSKRAGYSSKISTYNLFNDLSSNVRFFRTSGKGDFDGRTQYLSRFLAGL